MPQEVNCAAKQPDHDAEVDQDEIDIRVMAISLIPQLPTDEQKALRILDLARKLVTNYVHGGR